MGEVALMSPTLPSGITDSISISHWRNSDGENILLKFSRSFTFPQYGGADTSCYFISRDTKKLSRFSQEEALCMSTCRS